MRESWANWTAARRLSNVAQSTLTGAFDCRKGAHALVHPCGCSSSAERHLPGLEERVRPLPSAPLVPVTRGRIRGEFIVRSVIRSVLRGPTSSERIHAYGDTY